MKFVIDIYLATCKFVYSFQQQKFQPFKNSYEEIPLIHRYFFQHAGCLKFRGTKGMIKGEGFVSKTLTL